MGSGVPPSPLLVLLLLALLLEAPNVQTSKSGEQPLSVGSKRASQATRISLNP
jgi:hypothetical protein